VRDNRRAFFVALALALVGAGLAVASLLGQGAGFLSPLAFMIVHGLALYLPYVVFHTTLFERLIALTRDRGTIGYLMYLADAIGYVGYAAVMLARNVVGSLEDFLDFYLPLSWVVATACALLLVPSWRYFASHATTQGRDG